jgi:hypothetical protein
VYTSVSNKGLRGTRSSHAEATMDTSVIKNLVSNTFFYEKELEFLREMADSRGRVHPYSAL